MPAGQAAARSSGTGDFKGGVQNVVRPATSKDQLSQTISSDSGRKQCFWRYQSKVFKFYQSPRVMYFVAGLILGNFIMECIQRQIDPFVERYRLVWRISEVFFSSVFLVELLINMYGSWFKHFFSIGWNYFDMLVVAIGILTIFEVKLPGPLSQILMLRAFRVFRLFARIASLQKIIMSISYSIPGVMNALFIMALVVCIFAVLAVDLFRTAYEGSTANTPGAYSSRGELYGEEYYGTFSRALYTLFQILTGESWSEAGVRPLLWEPNASVSQVVIAAIFFMLFVFINSIVLLNVVVAVLLDGMNSAGHQDESETYLDDMDEHGDMCDPSGGEQDIRKELGQVKRELAELSTDLNDLLASIRTSGMIPDTTWNI